MWKVNLRELFRFYDYRKIGFSSLTSLMWLSLEKLLIFTSLLGLDYLYEIFVKYLTNSRKLRPEERRLAATIFRSSLDFDRVRINENRSFGTQKGKVVYASIRSINSYHSLDRRTLIHELTHIWQYQKYGVSYIMRALAAQASPQAYQYGKESFFRDWVIGRNDIRNLNYEQQASAIEEFYAQLYLNAGILSLGSGELWEIDKRMFKFLTS